LTKKKANDARTKQQLALARSGRGFGSNTAAHEKVTKPSRSGLHKLSRRTFRTTAEEFARQDAAAKKAGDNWSDWARKALSLFSS
jgi:hypothetical protein